MKTPVSPYFPSYPVMIIKGGGATMLVADPSLDLSKWKFVMPSMIGQTAIGMQRTDTTVTSYNTALYDGASGWTGVSSSVVTPPTTDPDPNPTKPVGYLPDQLNNVWVYLLNNDGTVSAVNGNASMGPLTASYDGTTWKYTDAWGVTILNAQNTTTGAFQVENGFISYGSYPGSSNSYILISNDKIDDPSRVTWSNQNGSVPGSTPYPSFGGGKLIVAIVQP